MRSIYDKAASLLNEPLDFATHYEVEPLTAIGRARKCWGKAELICEEET